jgi:hypothetical protein
MQRRVLKAEFVETVLKLDAHAPQVVVLADDARAADAAERIRNLGAKFQPRPCRRLAHVFPLN